MITYIYKTTVHNDESSLNNKFYVGKHTWSGSDLDPNYFGSGILIQNYINKYGFDGLTCEILEVLPFVEDINISVFQYDKNRAREGYWIHKLQPELNLRSEGQVELCNLNTLIKRNIRLTELNNLIDAPHKFIWEFEDLRDFEFFKKLREKLYYWSKRDKKLEANKIWRSLHEEQRKEYYKQYYASNFVKNKEKINKKAKKWRDAHPDKVKENNVKYYQNNSDKCRENSSKYYNENRAEILLKAKLKWQNRTPEEKEKIKKQRAEYYKKRKIINQS